MIHLPTPVRYLTQAEDGVSHFRYVRDNLLLIRMFLRLSLEAIIQIFPGGRRHGRQQRGEDRHNESR